MSEAAGDFALRLCKIAAIGLETVSPDVGTVLGVDQLRVHLHLIAHPTDAAFEHVANV